MKLRKAWLHTWELAEPLLPARCMPERPLEGGLERDGASAAFAGEVLAAELPQVLPESSHSLSARVRQLLFRDLLTLVSPASHWLLTQISA